MPILRPSKYLPAFSLIELMVVIAIVAILASVAIPVYQDNLRKSNVSKILSNLNAMQTNLTDAYMLTGHWPASLDGTAENATSSSTAFDFVQSFRYDTKTNSAWYGYKLSSDYGAGWIFMLLNYQGGIFEIHCGSISTDCTLGSCDSVEYYPSGCDETGLGTTYSIP